MLNRIKALFSRGSYTCVRCNTRVRRDEQHVHTCPIEYDKCGSRRCNETGMCQA